MSLPFGLHEHLIKLMFFFSRWNLKIMISILKWASSWDYDTCRIGDQRRLRRACASAQSRQTLHYSHKYSSRRRFRPKKDIYPTGWLRMHVYRMSLRGTKSTIIPRGGSKIVFVVQTRRWSKMNLFGSSNLSLSRLISFCRARAWLDARLIGIQTVAGSILRYGKTICHGDWSRNQFFAILSLSLIK